MSGQVSIPMPRRPYDSQDIPAMVGWHDRMEVRCAAMAWWSQAARHALLAARLVSVLALRDRVAPMTPLLPPDVAIYLRRSEASTVEAVRFDGTDNHAAQILRWGNSPSLSARVEVVDRPADGWTVMIRDGAVTSTVAAGDWVVKGVLGQCYLVPDDIFSATYRAITVDPPMPVNEVYAKGSANNPYDGADAARHLTST